MKAHRFVTIALLLMAASMAVMTGCEYDVAQPQWDKDYSAPATPRITQIEPAQAAKAGVNIITIRGENFAVSPDTNIVYFDNLPGEIVASSATSISARRPNLETDSCTVKVVSSKAIVVAKYGPYTIDRVLERYGSFLDNLPLSVVAVDNAENLYVVELSTRNISKVTPSGQKKVIGVATRVPTDARIGPGGRLYLPENNRAIDVVDVTTGEVKVWRNLPSGRVVRFGDFDANGYFYCGGLRSDLMIVTPDSTFRPAGMYTGASEIVAVRVHGGYVYVAAKAPSGQTPAVAIWRHSLDSIALGGNVGARQLFLDWDATGQFASRSIRGITFASNGTMYIATDAADPLLVVDPATQSVDIMYKGILPSYCKQFYWGKASYLYMISGNTAPAQEWTVYRVDLGTTGAP